MGECIGDCVRCAIERRLEEERVARVDSRSFLMGMGSGVVIEFA